MPMVVQQNQTIMVLRARVRLWKRGARRWVENAENFSRMMAEMVSFSEV